MNSMQNRNRVPEGVPTGGQFAASRKAEAGPSTLSPGPTGAGGRPPNMLTAPMRLDAAREWGRKAAARRDADLWADRAEAITAELEHLDEKDPNRLPLIVERGNIITRDAPKAALAARRAAVLHAAADPDALQSLMEESVRLRQEDPDLAKRYGLDGPKSRIATDVLHTRGALEEMQDQGVGRDCGQITQEDVLEAFPVGSRLRITQLHGTGAGYLSDPQRVVYTDDSHLSVLPGGRPPETHDLTDTRPVLDDGGRVVLLDRETYTPMLALHPVHDDDQA